MQPILPFILYFQGVKFLARLWPTRRETVRAAMPRLIGMFRFHVIYVVEGCTFLARVCVPKRQWCS
jgi:hypothetical protein